MSIDRYDSIDEPRDETADSFLADRFARVKGSILPHVTEIGRHQNDPRAALPSKRFGCQQQGNQLLVRAIE